MSELFNRIRAIRPDYADASDQEIATVLGVPYEAPPEADFATGLKHGLKSLVGTGYGAVGLLGDTLGSESVRDWGFKGYQDTMASMQPEHRPQYTAEGVEGFGDAADFAQYWLGYGISNMAAGLGTGAIGSMIAKRGGKEFIEAGVEKYIASKVAQGVPEVVARDVANKTVRVELAKELAKKGQRGFVAGVAPHAFGQELGATYGEAGEYALEQGKTLNDVDLGQVWAGGTAAGALEFASDIFVAGLLKIGPGKQAVNLLERGAMPSRMLKKGLFGSQAEGLTEMGQTGLEQWGARRPEPDYLDPTSYFAGAIPGGAAGTLGGIRKPYVEQAVANTEDALSQSMQQFAAEQQRALQEQQAQAEAEQAAAAQEAKRLQYSTQFPRDQFLKERQDALTADALSAGNFDSAYNEWRVKNTYAPDTPKNREAFVKEFSKQFKTKEVTERLNQEYVQALDTFIADSEATAEQQRQKDAAHKAAYAARKKDLEAAFGGLNFPVPVGEAALYEPRKPKDFVVNRDGVVVPAGLLNVFQSGNQDLADAGIPEQRGLFTGMLGPARQYAEEPIQEPAVAKDDQTTEMLDAQGGVRQEATDEGLFLRQQFPEKEPFGLFAEPAKPEKSWVAARTEAYKDHYGARKDRLFNKHIEQAADAYGVARTASGKIAVETFDSVRNLIAALDAEAISEQQFSDLMGIVKEHPRASIKVELDRAIYDNSQRDKTHIRAKLGRTEVVAPVGEFDNDLSSGVVSQAQMKLLNALRQSKHLTVAGDLKMEAIPEPEYRIRVGNDYVTVPKEELLARWEQMSPLHRLMLTRLTGQNIRSGDPIGVAMTVKQLSQSMNVSQEQIYSMLRELGLNTEWKSAEYRGVEKQLNKAKKLAGAIESQGRTTVSRTRDIPAGSVRVSELEAQLASMRNDPTKYQMTDHLARLQDGQLWYVRPRAELAEETSDGVTHVNEATSPARDAAESGKKPAAYVPNPEIERIQDELGRLRSAKPKNAKGREQVQKQMERLQNRLRDLRAAEPAREERYNRAAQDAEAMLLKSRLDEESRQNLETLLGQLEAENELGTTPLDEVSEEDLLTYERTNNEFDGQTEDYALTIWSEDQDVGDVAYAITTWETEGDLTYPAWEHLSASDKNEVVQIATAFGDTKGNPSDYKTLWSNLDDIAARYPSREVPRSVRAAQAKADTPQQRIARAEAEARTGRKGVQRGTLTPEQEADTRAAFEQRAREAEDAQRQRLMVAETGQGNLLGFTPTAQEEAEGATQEETAAPALGSTALFDERGQVSKEVFDSVRKQIADIDAILKTGISRSGTPAELHARKAALTKKLPRPTRRGEPAAKRLKELQRQIQGLQEQMQALEEAARDAEIGRRLQAERAEAEANRPDRVNLEAERAKNLAEQFAVEQLAAQVEMGKVQAKLDEIKNDPLFHAVKMLEKYRADVAAGETDTGLKVQDLLKRINELNEYRLNYGMPAKEKGKVAAPKEVKSKDTLLASGTPQIFAGHSVNSLTATLSNLFPGIIKAIQDGRVVILRNQDHAESLGLRGRDTVGSRGGRLKYQGLYDPRTGKVYFVAGNITQEASGFDALAVALHEIGEHAGMEEFLGSGAYDKLLGEISRAMRGHNQTELGRAVKQALDRALPKQKTDPREVLAYLIQHTPKAGFLKSLWAGIRAWAFRKFGVMLKLDSDVLRALAMGATKQWVVSGGGPKGGLPMASGTDLASLTGQPPIPGIYAGVKGSIAVNDVAQMWKTGKNWVKPLSDLVEDLVNDNILPSAKKWYESYNKALAERTRMEREAQDIAARALRLPKAAYDRVNDFISKSTFEQKWGYDVTFANRSVKADTEMAKEFAKLDKAEQEIVKAVFDHGERMAVKREALFKKFGLNRVMAPHAKMEGPYAPLMRFGDWVVQLRSKELDALENDFYSKSKADKDYSKSPAGKAQLEKINTMKSDGSHYLVSHFDTKGQAQNFADSNRASYGTMPSVFKQTVRNREAIGMDAKTLNMVLAGTKAANINNPQAKAAFTNMVQGMWVKTLDSQNARMHGVRRLNRAGFDKDMIRSFLAHAKADAGFMANMEYGSEINENFVALERESEQRRPDGYRATEDFNLIAKHYEDMLTAKDTPISNAITGLTTFYMLTTSVGYHLQNLSQPMMVTLPRLAADFNNYTGAASQLSKGYKMVRQLVNLNRDGVTIRPELNLSAVKDSGLRAMLEKAQDMQILDVGLEENLSQLERFKTGYKWIDNSSGFVADAFHRMYQVARAVELTNRVSTAVAAYNMASESGTKGDPTEYAIRVLQTTQGDFTHVGAPLVLKKIPKIIGQYRKFQIMMASLYSRAFQQAWSGATPEEKAVGRRMLAYMLFHASVAAGALGWPMMNIAALALALMGDDDEPKNLERWLRENIGDKQVADLLLRGPFHALGLGGISTKLGQQNTFSIAPFVDFEPTREGFQKAAGSVLTGPAGSQAGRMLDAVGYFNRGDYYRGIEQTVPKGVADAMASWRYANRGYEDKYGNVIVNPEAFTPWLLTDAIGLPSSEVQRVKWTRSQQYEIKEFYANEERALRDALRTGQVTRTEAMQKWKDLQEGKRNVAWMFSDHTPDELKFKPYSRLLKSVRRAEDTEQEKQDQFGSVLQEDALGY